MKLVAISVSMNALCAAWFGYIGSVEGYAVSSFLAVSGLAYLYVEGERT